MNKSEEDAERLIDFYLFLKRRYVYVLIENGNYDDAESILEKMIENDESADFAKDELDYIKKQIGESNNEKK
jgi:pentatricopeptide repeat protein